MEYLCVCLDLEEFMRDAQPSNLCREVMEEMSRDYNRPISARENLRRAGFLEWNGLRGQMVGAEDDSFYATKSRNP